MKTIFKTALFTVKGYDFTVLDMLWVVLILAGGFLLGYLLRKVRIKSLRSNIAHTLEQVGLLIISTSAFTAIVEIIYPEYWKLKFLTTSWFKITYVDFVFVVTVPVLSFLVIRLFRFILLKPAGPAKRSSLLLLAYVIWSISLSYIAKALLRDFSRITELELITIKKVSVTLFDLWFITIVLAVTSLSLRALKRFFDTRAESLSMDAGTGAAVFQIIKYILWVLAVVLILQTAGFDITLIIAGSAALLVGLGMGIQQVFGDITSGIILLIERPLKEGDIVEADGILGIVQHIGVRTTTLLTRDDTHMRIPNSKFISEKLENLNDEIEQTRFRIDVGVAYGSDIDLVMSVLKACALAHEKVDRKPEPFARFQNFGNSALEFSLFFWSKENFRFEQIKSDIRVLIDKKFRKNNITVPFPQRDVHIYNHNNE